MNRNPLSENNASADYFCVKERNSSYVTEALAGVTTFATMAYILAVNPAILSEAGMPASELIVVTAIAAAVFSILMGLIANIPVAQAPGMGANALFAYTLVLSQGIPWQSALGLVFWSGVIFLLLTVLGIRQILLNAFPPALRYSLTVGIGLFIAFIGVKNAGLVTAADAPLLITIGDLKNNATTLSVFGLVVTVALLRLRVPGAILIGIALVTSLGIFISSAGESVTQLPERILALPSFPDEIFMQLDISFLWREFDRALPGLLTLIFLDLFSSLVALNAMCQRAGLADETGSMKNPVRGLSADALATIGAAMLGTSTTNVYAESAAGIESGGRTGVTAIVVGLLFAASIFFSPLIAIVPTAATSPALIIIGVLMFSEVRRIEFNDMAYAAPAVLTIFLMPLTSISDGMAIGLITYVCIMILSGAIREIHWLSVLLALTLITYYVIQ